MSGVGRGNRGLGLRLKSTINSSENKTPKVSLVFTKRPRYLDSLIPFVFHLVPWVHKNVYKETLLLLGRCSNQRRIFLMLKSLVKYSQSNEGSNTSWTGISIDPITGVELWKRPRGCDSTSGERPGSLDVSQEQGVEQRRYANTDEISNRSGTESWW